MNMNCIHDSWQWCTPTSQRICSDRDPGWGVAGWNRMPVAGSRCGRAWRPMALHISDYHNIPSEWAERWGACCWLEHIALMKKLYASECITSYFWRKRWKMWGQLMTCVETIESTAMIVFLCVEVQLKKRDKMRIVMRSLVSYVK